MDLFEQGQERPYLIERKGIRSIAQSRVRIRMHFQKNAVGSRGYRGSGEVLHELPLASGGGAQSTRELNAVGRIENDGEAEALHHRDGADVYDQVVVAERGPSFRKEDTVVAR
jgi:hypothetical protein